MKVRNMIRVDGQYFDQEEYHKNIFMWKATLVLISVSGVAMISSGHEQNSLSDTFYGLTILAITILQIIWNRKKAEIKTVFEQKLRIWEK